MPAVPVKQLDRVLSTVLISATLIGCEVRAGEGVQEATPPRGDIVQFQEDEVAISASFAGYVAAPKTVTRGPRFSGYIEWVVTPEGELVEEEDISFELGKRPYQSRIQLPEAEFVSAKNELELTGSESIRAEHLWKERAIPREEFEERDAAQAVAHAAADAASANLQSAQVELKCTRINLPVTGRFGWAEVPSGNLATAATTVLANLVSVDPPHFGL